MVWETNHELDMDKVMPGLFLGAEEAEQAHISRLKDHTITHVLQLGPGLDQMPTTHPNELVYKRILVGDSPHWDLVKLLVEKGAFAFVDEGIKAGGVLVHCQAGISRSATAVIAYLMLREQDTPNFLEALAAVMQHRDCIRPSKGFCKQLKALEVCGGDLAKYDKEDGASFVTSTAEYDNFWK